jgi:exopolyphosphatase / guanosine-5'-triphosphate,3'-diphosphate pyrophosphatase
MFGCSEVREFDGFRHMPAYNVFRMEPIRRAVIDVGTNSVKLLVADVAGHNVHPLCETSKQTRLGQGFYQTHRLQAGPIADSAQAVADFAAKAREFHAVSIRVIATSAARDALNAAELTSAIEQVAGLRTEIISGEQEADLVFRGATTGAQFTSAPLLLLEVGGGSTEFILGQGDHKVFSHSFALGTVRLLEQLPHSDPPQASELAACRQMLEGFLSTEVRPKLEPALAGRQGVRLIGTGGTASILGCMEAKLDKFDRERLEATRLSLERLHWHAAHLWGLPLEQRRQTIGLPKNRADVILTGVAIFEAVLELFGFSELCISSRGLRFAALLD